MLLLRAILLIVLALSSLFLAGLNILWIAGDAGKVAPTTKSMHLVHLDDSEADLLYHKPRSYFTLDWLMRPASTAPFKDAKFTVNSDLCYNEEENCSPQLWQTSKFCFYGHQKTNDIYNGTQWLSDQHILHTSHESVSQQIFGRSDEDDKNVGGMTWAFNEDQKYVVSKNNGMAAASTCQNTRLNSAKVIVNDPSVWSLASMHSPFVLLCFIYFIFFLLALFEIYVDEYAGVEWHANNSTAKDYFSFLQGDNAVSYYDFAVVAVLAVIILAKMQTAGIITEMSAEYARAHPNGSYLYGVGMLIVFAYYAHNRIKREKDHGIKKNYKMANKDKNNPPNVVATDAAAQPLTWNLQTFGSNGSTLKTNAQLMNVDHVSKQASIKIAHEPMLHSGCIVVFCVLPLWILVAYIVGNGFVLDCNLQALFLAGFVYALVDMYGTFLSESLHVVMGHGKPQEKHDLFTNPLTGTTVYMLVIQIITVIFINVVLMTQNVSVAVSTSTDGDQTDLRVTLSQIGIWLLNIYFVFNALEKVLRLYFSDKKPIRVFDKTRFMVFDTSDELLLFVFVALVFLHGIIIMASYTSSAENYLFRIDADLTKELQILSTNFVKEKMLWAASWTQLS